MWRKQAGGLLSLGLQPFRHKNNVVDKRVVCVGISGYLKNSAAIAEVSRLFPLSNFFIFIAAYSGGT